MIKNKIGWFLFCIFLLVLLFILSNRWENLFRKEISSDPAFSSAIFIRQGYIKGAGYVWFYVFKVSGVSVEGWANPGKLLPYQNVLFEHSFPVIYNKADSSSHKLLMFPSDFEELNLPFPDSLNWIKEYL